MDQEIVDYILQAQKHGLAELEIKQNLLDAGWEANTVEQSFIFARAADTHTGTRDVSQSLAGYPGTQKTGPVRQPAAFQNTHTTISISEQNFKQKPLNQPFFKRKTFWAVLVLLLVIGGSAFSYYEYVYLTPKTIFNKFLAVKRPLASQSDYSLSYSYTDASSSEPITVTLSGSLYTNNQNASSSESSNAFTLGFKSQVADASVNLQYLILNQILYLDVSQISQLKSLGSDWVRLDLAQFQNYLNANSATTGQTLNKFIANAELKTKIQNLTANANIVVLSGSMAKETVKNVPAYHLNFTIDNQSLAKTTVQIIDLIQADASFKGEKLTDAQKNAISAVLQKLTLKEGGVWIGQKDHQLYQIHLALNVPSAQDLSDPNFINSVPVLDQSLVKERDAARLSDSREIGQALLLYYNDHGGYPAGQGGVPQGLVPKYIFAWPKAPAPPDGTCTDYYNGYWYQNKGATFVKNGDKLYPSFTLTFCLGQDTGGYGAGIGMVTPQGISGNILCPSTPDLCVNKSPGNPEDLQAKINALQFNSSLVFDDTFYNFGKIQTLKAPENSLDLMQLLQGFFGSMFQSSSTAQTLTQ